MNDLTQIKGIGPATAKALAANGIDSVAALAQAEPVALAGVAGLPGSPGDYSYWIAQARKLAETNTKGGGNASATVPAQTGQTAGPDGAKAEAAPSAAEAAPAGEGPQGENSPESGQSGTAREAPGDQSLPNGDVGDLQQEVQPAAQHAPTGAGDTAGPARRAVIVTGPKRGRWRVGKHFTREPRTVEVTEEQLAAIDADPTLSWRPAE